MSEIQIPLFRQQDGLAQEATPEFVALLNTYRDVESKTTVITKLNKVTYEAPVNFNESMRQPRHRWFPYKEGFSPSFVSAFINQQNYNGHLRILDPFSGVGTTVLQAGIEGKDGIGVDVNPLAHFVSMVKAISLNETQLKEFNGLISVFVETELHDLASLPHNPTVISYFEESYLEALLAVKHFFTSMVPEPYNHLFKLAWLSLLENFSTHRKAGNGVKRKTKLEYKELQGSPLNQVKSAISNLLLIYARDVQSCQLSGKTEFFLGSLINESLDIGVFDCILTSPPYANCFDYSKIYLSELWLGDFYLSKRSQHEMRQKSIRSHVHATWPERFENSGSEIADNLIVPMLSKSKLWSPKIPDMISGYFKDIGHLLEVVLPMLKPNALVGFVVSNSVYAGIPVATDLLIANLGAKQGLTVDRVEVYRKIVTASQQWNQLNDRKYLRESLVVMRKP